MDFQLTAEQQRVQTLAREFAQNEVAPIAREADETGIFPIHLVKRMGEVATHMLLKAIGGEPVSNVVLPDEPRLVVRASTAPPPVRHGSR